MEKYILNKKCKYYVKSKKKFCNNNVITNKKQYPNNCYCDKHQPDKIVDSNAPKKNGCHCHTCRQGVFNDEPCFINVCGKCD